MQLVKLGGVSLEAQAISAKASALSSLDADSHNQCSSDGISGHGRSGQIWLLRIQPACWREAIQRQSPGPTRLQEFIAKKVRRFESGNTPRHGFEAFDGKCVSL